MGDHNRSRYRWIANALAAAAAAAAFACADEASFQMALCGGVTDTARSQNTISSMVSNGRMEEGEIFDVGVVSIAIE